MLQAFTRQALTHLFQQLSPWPETQLEARMGLAVALKTNYFSTEDTRNVHPFELDMKHVLPGPAELSSWYLMSPASAHHLIKSSQVCLAALWCAKVANWLCWICRKPGGSTQTKYMLWKALLLNYEEIMQSTPRHGETLIGTAHLKGAPRSSFETWQSKALWPSHILHVLPALEPLLDRQSPEKGHSSWHKLCYKNIYNLPQPAANRAVPAFPGLQQSPNRMPGFTAGDQVQIKQAFLCKSWYSGYKMGIVLFRRLIIVYRRGKKKMHKTY